MTQFFPSPIRVALIGCGRRGQGVYFPILRALKSYFEVVAVCDRVPELGMKGAEYFGVPAYDSLHALTREAEIEAAIVVTPPSSHHALSCFLSENKIHHIVETPMCDMLAQARQMTELAAANGVLFRIAEQFFYDPWDVLARRLIEAGVLGSIGRITNHQAHLGYHNNSRHQVFAGSPPLAVNCVAHEMAVEPYVNTERHFTSEKWQNISFHFPSGLLVSDLAGNIKGALGRYSRPGLQEIDGSQGAFVVQASSHWTGRAEVRLCDEENRLHHSAQAEIYPVEFLWQRPNGEVFTCAEQPKFSWYDGEDTFAGVRVQLPQGEFYVPNEFLELGLKTAYHPEVAGVLRDFALLLRTGTPDVFTPKMAVASLQMELAATLSARRDGARVFFDDPALQEIDETKRAALQQKWSFDPLDVEANLNYCFPKP